METEFLGPLPPSPATAMAAARIGAVTTRSLALGPGKGANRESGDLRG